MARGPGLLNPFLLSKSLPRRGKKIVKHFLTEKRYPSSSHPSALMSLFESGSSRGPRRGGKSVEKHESASYAVHLVLVAIHQTSAIAFFFFLPFPLPSPHRNPCVASSSGPASCRSSPLPLPPSTRTRLGEVFPRRFFKRAIVNGGTKQSRDNTVEIFSRLDLII